MSHLNTSFFIRVIREREIITKHIGKHAHFLVFVYINLIFFSVTSENTTNTSVIAAIVALVGLITSFDINYWIY